MASASSSASSLERLEEQGVAYLQQALAKEKQNDLEGAFACYHQGFEILMKCVKQTKNAQRKAALRAKISKCMSIAEEIKKKISKNSPRAGSKRNSGSGKSGSVEEKALASIDPKLVQQIESEIINDTAGVTLDSVAGLDDVKQALYEMVIFPLKRPDLFTGLRSPPHGLLLFGPPGNGKTLIAKAVASAVDSTFFNISASSLTSKYMGEGEKLVKALFALARARQPSIIFIDEIDSILSKRSADENDASRRLKTEFLVQFNAITAENSADHVLVIGATNMPEQLDDAVVRRFTKRIFIGQPDPEARADLITKLLAKEKHTLTRQQLAQLVKLTEGYSGSDLRALCQEAAMGPLRELGARIEKAKSSDVGKITFAHFQQALATVLPSVSPERLRAYAQWHQERIRASHANQQQRQQQLDCLVQSPDDAKIPANQGPPPRRSHSNSHPPPPFGPPPPSVIARARAQGTLVSEIGDIPDEEPTHGNCRVG